MPWVDVLDRLPEKFLPVVLIDMTQCESHINYGDPLTRYRSSVGYLNDWGGPYWSIRGERATLIESFTHWMPLPEPPKECA